MKALLAFLLLGTLLATTPVLQASAQSPNSFRIVVIAPSIANPGEKISIFIETTLDGTPTSKAVTLAPHVLHHDHGSIIVNFVAAPSSFADGHWNTTYTVPANAEGTFWIHVPGILGSLNATGSASFVIATASSSGTGSNSLYYILVGLAVVVIILQAAIFAKMRR